MNELLQHRYGCSKGFMCREGYGNCALNSSAKVGENCMAFLCSIAL